MIKCITDVKSDKTRGLLHIETQAAIERLKIDRSESSFGGRSSLTQAEIRQSAKLGRQVHKVTAW